MQLSLRRSRTLRAVATFVRVVGLGATFALALLVGLLLHLRVPAARRGIVSTTNQVLPSVLAGRVEIERLEHVGLDGVSGVQATVRDPEGVVVMHVDGLAVHVDGLAVVRSAIGGSDPIRIDVSRVAIANLHVNLDADGGGALRVANAFAPKKASSPEPPGPPGRGLRVDAALALRHAWIHGTPPGEIPLDVDLHELAVGAHLDPSSVRADLERLRLDARALPRHVDPHGNVTARFTMSLVDTKPPDVEATFDGTIGAMPTQAEAKMVGGQLDARVHTQDPTGKNARALAPEVQLSEALSLHVEAHGPLSEIDTKVAIVLGRATVDATALVGLGTSTTVDGELHVRHADAHAIVESAPVTDIGLDAKGMVELNGSATRGEVAVDTLPGKVGEEPIPPIEIRAKHGGGKAEAQVKIDEPTAPTLVTASLTPRADGREGERIVATVRSTIPDLRRIPRVGALAGATGYATVDASGSFTLPERSFDAKATIGARGLVKGTQKVGSVDVVATATGSVDHPIVDAEVRARDVAAGDFALSSANARAHVEVEGSRVTIDDATVDLVRSERSIAARARRVHLDGRTWRVESAEVTGLGAPIHADVVKNASEIRAAISAPRIDVKTVGVVLGIPNLVSDGTIAIDGDATIFGAQAKANAHVVLTDVAAFGVQRAHATVDASIAGRDVKLDLRATVADAAELTLHTREVKLGGGALEPSSWMQARGEAYLATKADLQRIMALLPKETLPLSELAGTLELRGRIGRVSESAPPEAQLHLSTLGLVVAGASSTQTGILETVTTWRSPDIDIALDVQNDATSGQTAVAFRATDAQGTVASVDLKSVLPYEAILSNPGAAGQRAFEAPLSAKIVVPSRRLDQLPAVLGVPGLEGSANVEIDVSGTADEPKVRLVANARGLHTSAMPPALRPDADVGLDYDGKRVRLTTKVRANGRDLVDLSANADVRARDAIEHKPNLPWKAGGKLRLARFPLETFHEISDRRIRGTISGEVTLDGLHEDGRLRAKIDLERLAVGDATYERGTITVDAEKGNLKARARLDQAVDHAGFFEANATAGIVWGGAIVPALDGSREAEARLVAKDFRALVAQPFVQDVVPKLDGVIDADASAKVVGGGPPTVRGKLVLRDGTVLPAALGAELRGVRGTATMTPDGTIHVTDVSARSIQGEIAADATVRLAKLRLATATANIRIAESKPFALMLDGAPVGDVAGTAQIDVVDSGGRLAVTIDVPTFSVELPQTIKSGVQGVAPKENVKVGVFRRSNESSTRESTLVPLLRDKPKPPESSDTDPSKKVEVEVMLGKITINRPNSAQIVLSGRPKLVIDKGARMSGQIRLDSGWANLRGKKFKIERGTVTFTEETPPNPVVVATAVWVAPSGARVYADFVGPAKTGKVVLRSEPPMKDSDILALILFGSADGANSARPQSGGSPDGKVQAAQGLGGGLVAEGLTQALDDLAGIKANARIDTSRSNNPRPEVEFQLSPKVSVAFSHVLGTPPITEPDKNLTTVGWRVYRNWSLETTVGDGGRALVDAIWQHRY